MLDLLHLHSYWNFAAVIVQSHAQLIPSSLQCTHVTAHLKGSGGCKSTSRDSGVTGADATVQKMFLRNTKKTKGNMVVE